MLAFVLDGDVTAAIKGILRNINAKRNELALLDEQIGLSRFARDNQSMRETTHTRTTEAGNVLIQHFFMAVNRAALSSR